MNSLDQQQLESFYANGDFIEPDNQQAGSPIQGSLLWEDYKEVKGYILNDSNLFVYTVVAEGEDAYILDGYHYIDRIGYFLSRTPINLPSDGIRYW